MRLFALLVEELESRPADADRVAALARWLRAVGRDAGALAGGWLVVGAKPRRPARLTQRALAEAAARLAAGVGVAPWLFEVGVDTSSEAAEAVAMMLPWPEAAVQSSFSQRPTLVDWLASWHAAAASPPDGRADAIAATIAALDDAFSRRWAVRAVCGLARPLASAWQWQQAWARAFDEDVHALAWAWHRAGTFEAVASAALAHLRPRAFAPLPEAPAHEHAGLIAAWRAGGLQAEPRWRGERVQVVRHGGDIAVWRRAGGLANAALPEAWLAAGAWPDPCVIDGVLVARQGDAVVDIEIDAGDATLHLVLVDWQRWAADEGHALPAGERRARLQARWPAVEVDTAWGIVPVALPAVSTTPTVDVPAGADADELAALAARGRRAGWSGLVLRRGEDEFAWSVRAAVHRVRAVLQYVPSDALPSATALGFAECGFALWNRTPLSADEQRDAMTAAMSGEFLPAPTDAPELGGLRLLPLARVAVELPDDDLRAIHAWLRGNTGQRFGAMHAVAPVLVFELGFARVRASRRHRIGLVLERPRVLRWLRDAPAGGADRVVDLVDGLDTVPGSPDAAAAASG